MFLRNCNKGKIGRLYKYNVQKDKAGYQTFESRSLKPMHTIDIGKTRNFQKRVITLIRGQMLKFIEILIFIDVELLVNISDRVTNIVILSIRQEKVSSNPKQNPLSPPVTTSHILCKISQM